MKKIVLASLLALPTVAMPALAAAPTPPMPPVIVPPDGLLLFAITGQSNASGRGPGPYTPAFLATIAELGGPDGGPRGTDGIYNFGNDYQWREAREPIDRTTGQIDLVSSHDPAGVGPALAFAVAYKNARPDVAIGLIPCAAGGTSLAAWSRPETPIEPDDPTTLYGSCLKRIGVASQYGTIAGILFFQGEADALPPTVLPDADATTWADRFTVLVHDWRHDLHVPHLPVVFAQIGTTTNPAYVYWSDVQEQQALAAESLAHKHVNMITTDDLPLLGSVHFTTESYVVIGERFAESMVNLTVPDAPPHGDHGDHGDHDDDDHDRCEP